MASTDGLSYGAIYTLVRTLAPAHAIPGGGAMVKLVSISRWAKISLLACFLLTTSVLGCGTPRPLSETPRCSDEIRAKLKQCREVREKDSTSEIKKRKD